MTKRISISISKGNELLWETWNSRQKNTSQALMLLIRKDLQQKRRKP